MKNKGISLIVLIITIIVIIILAGVVILSLVSNNPMEEATEAKFKENIQTYQAELTLWLSNEYIEHDGILDVLNVNADNMTGDYESLQIHQIILTMGDKQGGYTEDATKFVIKKGILLYKGTDEQEKEWAAEVGMGQDDTNTQPIEGDYDTAKGVNRPKLATNMTPIKWVEGELKTTTEQDSTWYDYAKGEWANAQTLDGSMWVWIPRYIYRIPEIYWHKTAKAIVDIQFTKGIEDDWNKDLIGEIDRDTTANASRAKWTNHPAFTFGDKEVVGIWVAKFKASSVEGNGNNWRADNVASKTLQIKPGVQCWRYINGDNIFKTCRRMETKAVYGWGDTGDGIDTHLIKNVEWGGMAYLATSVYGLNGTAIQSNSNAGYITGGDVGNAYITNSGQSCTGTVYGIYELASAAVELTSSVMGNIPGGSQSIIQAEAKYRNNYKNGSSNIINEIYPLTVSSKGDGIYETSTEGGNIAGNSSWYNEKSLIPYTTSHFLRGYGLVGFGTTSGDYYPNMSFRPVLLVGEGL